MAVVAASAPQQSLLLLVAATALLITPMLVVCQEPALASVPDPGPLTRVGSTYKGPRTTSVLKDGIYQHVDETPGGYRRYTINVQIVTETVAGTPSWNPGNAFTSSGSLVDLSNGRAKSGSWNCVNTATSKTEKNGEKITYVGIMVMTLNSEDALSFTGAMKIQHPTFMPQSAHLIVTGGTGRFMGAIGDISLTRSDKFSAPNRAEGWATIYVPKGL